MLSGCHEFDIDVEFKIQICVLFSLCFVFIIFNFLSFLGSFFIFYMYISLLPGISQHIYVYLVVLILLFNV